MSKEDEDFSPQEAAERVNEFYATLDNKIKREDRVKFTLEAIKSGTLFPVETPEPMMAGSMNTPGGEKKPNTSKL